MLSRTGAMAGSVRRTATAMRQLFGIRNTDQWSVVVSGQEQGISREQGTGISSVSPPASLLIFLTAGEDAFCPFDSPGPDRSLRASFLFYRQVQPCFMGFSTF